MKRFAPLLLALACTTAHAQTPPPFNYAPPPSSTQTLALSGVIGDFTIITQIRYQDHDFSTKVITAPFVGTYAQCQYAANLTDQRLSQFPSIVHSTCAPRHG